MNVRLEVVGSTRVSTVFVKCKQNTCTVLTNFKLLISAAPSGCGNGGNSSAVKGTVICAKNKKQQGIGFKLVVNTVYV